MTVNVDSLEDVLVLDGGLSTALEGMGYRVDGPLWTGELLLNDPEAIVRAHRAFVEAGADIIITGSYQVSFAGGDRLGISADDIERALRNSTTAARKAADEATLVAASVGPYGAFLNDGSEFRGRYGVTAAALREFHARRLDVLLDTQPDLLAIETIPDLDEAAIVLSLLAERDSETPFWVSFTVSEPGIVSGGGSFAEACDLVSEHSLALAVGINCSPLDVITPTLRGVETELPFVVYPNAGQSWDSSAMAWRGDPRWANDAELREWAELGSRIIGGCCGYAPRDIAANRH